MSQSTASEFEILCNLSFSVPEMARIISCGGHAGQNSLADYGLNFNVLNNLNENDLIYGEFNAKWSMKPFAETSHPFEYAGQIVWLKIADKSKVNSLSSVKGIIFSKVGREWRQIVSLQPDPRYTAELIKYFEGRDCDLIKAIGQQGDRWVGKSYRHFV